MKKTLLILMLGIYTNADAGLFGLTHHSRANCINNESISWDAREAHWLETDSSHLNSETSKGHMATDHFRLTRRSASVCWGEGANMKGNPIWTVIGRHWMKENESSKAELKKMEMVSDCSIYNGWWGMPGDIK